MDTNVLKKTLIALLILFQLNAYAPVAPAYIPKSKVEPVVAVSPILTAVDTKQIRCLADNVYHEARGEPDDGRLAVALVTMNRVYAHGFPDDVCGVVYDRCQFSWVCQHVKPSRSSTVYDEIYKLARETYLNYYNMVDITKRSLYYHAVQVNPGWNLLRTVRVGHHIFYRNKDKDVQQHIENARSGE